jgi:hypothetical protein
MPKRYTPTSAAADVEAALRLLEGRWKLVILFHLFGGKVKRFSDLERAISGRPLGATSSYLRVIAVTATQKQCTFAPGSTANHRLSNKTGSEMRHNFGCRIGCN